MKLSVVQASLGPGGKCISCKSEREQQNTPRVTRYRIKEYLRYKAYRFMRGFKYGKLISLVRLSHVVKREVSDPCRCCKNYQHSLTKPFSHTAALRELGCGLIKTIEYDFLLTGNSCCLVLELIRCILNNS